MGATTNVEGGRIMLLIDYPELHDPTLNLAIEEYALRHLPGGHEYLILYVNEPSIIIGKNQNTAEEIHARYVEDNSIHVVRRLSGGGAVYHDLGNLNFSFVTNDDGKSFHNFRKFTEPVVRALRSLGVEAELTGRNDLQVGERKISGNAQFASKGRIFSHGTLLYDSDMEAVAAALNANPEKFKSKSTKSVRSRVANITEFLSEPMSIDAFKAKLLAAIYEGRTPARYELTDEDRSAVRKLADERYRSWDWNYGRSPAFNMRKTKRLSAGTYDVRLNVEGGVIREAAVYGDFFSLGEASEFAAKLVGVRYDAKAIGELVDTVDLTHYFGPVTRDEWMELFFYE